ncbi:MAG: hypothetical protein ACSHW4_10795 [Cellulophaga sp.]
MKHLLEHLSFKGTPNSISAIHSGHTNTGGYWVVNASFNPSLFQKELDATMEQIKKWAKDGVTADELAAKKTNITGSFKVGLAGTVLNFVERGLEPSYIDQYSKGIEAVTLEQVNAAIKKYVDVNNLIVIKSGSLDSKGLPLE